MRSVFFILPVMLLGAFFAAPTHAQAFEDKPSAKAADRIFSPDRRKAGTVSRFQREVIVVDKSAKNPNASPASQYFDDVMDHLEELMADEIAKNNKIAVLQEKIPGYKF